MLYNNKNIEKPAKSSISLPVALLKSKECISQRRKTQPCCWFPRVWFTHVSTLQLAPCSPVKDCLQWLFLSLMVVNPRLLPCTVVCLPGLEDPLHPIYCYQYLLCYHTPVSHYNNSEGLDWGAGSLGGHRGCFNYQQFFQSCFLLNVRYDCKVSGRTGTPTSAILGLGREWWDTVFCFVRFQPLAALACS